MQAQLDALMGQERDVPIDQVWLLLPLLASPVLPSLPFAVEPVRDWRSARCSGSVWAPRSTPSCVSMDLAELPD